MEPLIFALRVDRPLTVHEAAVLSRAAEETAVKKYNKRPDMPDTELSLAGSVLMRLAAAKTLGVPAVKVTVLRGETGKPYLSGGDLYVSLSHSKNLCVCAVCDKPVGVDVEYIRESYPERVAEKYFDDGERRMLEAADTSGKAALFYVLWTRKESAVKCTGNGLSALSKTADSNLEIRGGLVFDEYAMSVCTAQKQAT